MYSEQLLPLRPFPHRAGTSSARAADRPKGRVGFAQREGGQTPLAQDWGRGGGRVASWILLGGRVHAQKSRRPDPRKGTLFGKRVFADVNEEVMERAPPKSGDCRLCKSQDSKILGPTEADAEGRAGQPSEARAGGARPVPPGTCPPRPAHRGPGPSAVCGRSVRPATASTALRTPPRAEPPQPSPDSPPDSTF